MSFFILDPRLEADTLFIKSLDTCELRLMNDMRWPWLILVPRLEDAIEWHELFTDQRQDIDMAVSQTAGILKAVTDCEKINIASLGNSVRQLHIHIIARSEDDPNWPGPVWGFRERVPYRDDKDMELIELLNAGFG